MLCRNFEYLFSSLGTRGHQWHRHEERDWFHDPQQYRGLTPPLWLWFKLLLEVLWHLSFCKSEIKLFISSPTCLRCITMHLSERDLPLENMIYSCLWYLRVPWLIPAVFELWVMLLRQNHRTPSRNTCCFKWNSMAHFKEETVLLYWFHVWCVKGSLKQNVQEHQLHFLRKRPHHLLIHSDFQFLSDAMTKAPKSSCMRRGSEMLSNP